MRIYFEDKDVIVCQKESGLLSEGDGRDCLPRILSEYLKEKGEGGEIYPVHRLDRETRGLIAYAKTQSAAAFLSREIAEGRMKKEYEALINGVPQKESGEMRDLLFYDRKKNRSYVVDRERKGVKPALLEYRTLWSRDGISLVRIRLHTGRTHQIRVQFASRKMPLVSDRRYGAPKSDVPFFLKACYLEFAHPVTKEPMRFETEEEGV